jgi:hypothetical protein
MLLWLYPTRFRQQFGEEMHFVFSESLRDAYEQAGSKGIVMLLSWTLLDFCTSLLREHVRDYQEKRKGQQLMKVTDEANAAFTIRTIEKWGALASFLLAVVFIVPEMIYLVGNLREANGPLTYAMADLLYGPVRAACLVMAIYALREHIGDRAPRQMSLAVVISILTAGMFVLAALLRSSNRGYHIMHPELNIESSSTILTVWTTVVGGVIATGWHFLGWSLLLIGSAAWASGRLPRALSVLYWLVGTLALFVYVQPEFEGAVVIFGAAMSIWQGILLLKAEPRPMPPPQINTSQPELA